MDNYGLTDKINYDLQSPSCRLPDPDTKPRLSNPGKHLYVGHVRCVIHISQSRRRSQSIDQRIKIILLFLSTAKRAGLPRISEWSPFHETARWSSDQSIILHKLPIETTELSQIPGLRSFKLEGIGQFVTAEIFSWSVLIPPVLITCPRYFTSCLNNTHFEGFNHHGTTGTLYALWEIFVLRFHLLV